MERELGAGFSLFPDFKTYSILCVWNDDKSANEFLNNSTHSIQISQKAFSRNDYFLKPIHSHGKWDGINPFPISNNNFEFKFTGCNNYKSNIKLFKTF